MQDHLSLLTLQAEHGVDETIQANANVMRGKKAARANTATKLDIVNNSTPPKDTNSSPDIKTNISSGVAAKTNHAPILTSDLRPVLGDSAMIRNKTIQIANSANDLGWLREQVINFKDLSIAKTATNPVFADGVPTSKIMLIGEAPGAEEDAKAIPFCGPSGMLLEQMLGHIGLFRNKNFYITNSIFWRPPGNRRPTPEEIAICLPLVEKHIALIKPKLIILVGATAISALLDQKKHNIAGQGISKLRGSFFSYENQYLSEPITTTAIFHPSYLLRSPGQKRLAWQDMLKIQDHINEL